MPRPSRRHKRRSAGFEDLDFKHLLAGPHGLPCRVGDAYDRGGTATVREAWEGLRSELLPQWVSDHPGRRPWSWWEFDSPGRRERRDEGVHPFDNKERSLKVANTDNPNFWKRAYGLSWGMPGAYLLPFDRDVYDDFFKNILRGKPSEVFEEEWSYLVRHNLLLPEDSP